MYSGTSGNDENSIGRGSRRRKLAGYLRAANDIRQSYQNAYSQRADEDDLSNIPGSFPDLKVSRNGTEEMVLFPSYAKQHTRKTQDLPVDGIGGDDLRRASTANDADYWRKEWEIHEDANAVVDVDVRGWIYTPQSGPMSRKNRLMLGIARRLSGISQTNSQPGSRSSSVASRGNSQEEEVVDREAQYILQRGEREADIAGRGGYSEPPGRMNSGFSSRSSSPRPGQLGQALTLTSLDVSGSVEQANRSKWPQPADMSQEELAIANRHMLMRIHPFMSTPAIGMAITIFFFDDQTSQSRTTRTNESGHFNFRAALSFVPTNVRVLASETLSASEEVKLTEPKGVSLISDIDDTVKHSGIGGRTLDIFLNVFVRELEDLTISGVRPWYNSLAKLGVKVHYVSNSPWQLFPVLNSFFIKAGLPPGSFHLKEYSGMFQGIFEPVAERKRGTIDRLIQDFPDRQFILVGDSGEADLEVYTETASMYPGRILGIFIRDVTTTPNKSFFDPSMSSASYQNNKPAPTGALRPTPANMMAVNKALNGRPALPPRPVSEVPLASSASDIGDLIDFSEELNIGVPNRSNTEPSNSSTSIPLAKVPSRGPPTPFKPKVLRSQSSEWSKDKPDQDSGQDSLPALRSEQPQTDSATGRKPVPPPPPKPRKLSASQQQKSMDAVHQMAPASLKQMSAGIPALAGTAARSMQAKVVAASNLLPTPIAPWSYDDPASGSRSRRSSASSNSSTNSSSSARNQDMKAKKMPPALPPRRGTGNEAPVAPAVQHSSSSAGPAAPADKRAELWHRRWERAQATLGPKGIMLMTWRVGSDVQKITEDLVKHAMHKTS